MSYNPHQANRFFYVLVHYQLPPSFISALTSINLSKPLFIRPSALLRKMFLFPHQIYSQSLLCILILDVFLAIFPTILQYYDTLLKINICCHQLQKIYYSYQYVLDVADLPAIFRHVLKCLRIVGTTETCSMDYN